MKKSEVRKEAIIDSAYKLFFEKGYDATTVRMIMRDVGYEIGLFYYYFENKDDLFDQVLDRFFENYKKDFEALADSSRRDPFRALGRFFQYMAIKTSQFRENEAVNLHRTIRWSIREQTLTIITPYLRQIIENLVSYGAKPALPPEVLSVMLSHGVGSFILHEDSTWFASIRSEVQKGVNLMMGLDAEKADLMFPFFAVNEDCEQIKELILENSNCFLQESTSSVLENLSMRISAHEVFVIRHNGNVSGCLIFSRERNSFDILATKKESEHQGVAARLIITAMAQYEVGANVYAMVCKSEENVDNRAFKLLTGMGFLPESEVLSEGRVYQKLTKKVTDCMDRGATATAVDV